MEGQGDTVFPQEEQNKLETEGHLYPDHKDPQFIEKLMKKKEYAESKQKSIVEQVQAKVNPCDPDREFELTPVQRFVSQLLSPSTPYNSALLYHGVGVGKTCAAITIAEGYLDKYPKDQVIIVAPRTIQPGFERTIFDTDGLQIGTQSEENTAKGCTGNTYLKLTGNLFERDKKAIETSVKKSIKKRYKLTGYGAFANEIEKIENAVKKGDKDQLFRELNRVYGGKVLIIDEAHNLRDTAENEEDNLDAAGAQVELSESAAGKKLTPLLQKLLKWVDGITLILLTGTPMYNSYKEIIFLLNLLLLNDKRNDELLSFDKVFNEDGTFKKLDGAIVGDKVLGKIAQQYVSFMRGENPLSFPTRLKPEGVDLLTAWPTKAPNGKPIESVASISRFQLPIVQCRFEGPSVNEYKEYSKRIVAAMEKIDIQTSNNLIQGGNWIFPATEDGQTIEDRIRIPGFDAQFSEKKGGGLTTFKSRHDKPTWLGETEIAKYSSKTAFLLRRLKTTHGCAFIYSRFVKAGALSIALALEANGYTLLGRERSTGFLQDGIQTEGGRQCARCPLKEKGHTGDHTFVPAKYVLLTGRDEFSPNNAASITAQRAKTNKMGYDVKIVIGSQVASEGIDLRYIREVFLFDSWFHLNKLEQVVGRGIRTCSHALLDDDKFKNCTINLLVNAFDQTEDMETIDLYTYRLAIKKAVEVGRVTRVLKSYAIDCNLNHDVVLVKGLEKITMEDGQGKSRPNVDRNDVPFTALCDWLETCGDTEGDPYPYKCVPEVTVNEFTADESTYTEFAAKWREQKLFERVRQLFSNPVTGQQPFVELPMFTDAFSDIPKKALGILLQTILRSKSFTMTLFGQKGRIIYKNNYFLFQPLNLVDETIPLALRISHVPIKRDSYEPEQGAIIEKQDVIKKPAAAAAAEPEEETDVLDFWTTLEEWSDKVKAGTIDSLPTDISEGLVEFHGGDERLAKRSKERLEMIMWFYKSIRGNEAWRGVLAKIILEVFWDEFLTAHSQQKLFAVWTPQSEKYKHVFIEHLLQSGSTTAFRFVDTHTGVLRYVCGERECTDLQKSVIETSAPDPYKSLKADVTTTGQRYGFVVPKRGEMIFKNTDAPAVGKKVEKGRECSIASGVQAHFERLRELGSILQTAVGTDLDLNNEKLSKSERDGGRKFENAVRACFLIDIVLRFMDTLKIQNKHWMYRSISAKFIGHKGEIEKA